MRLSHSAGSGVHINRKPLLDSEERGRGSSERYVRLVMSSSCNSGSQTIEMENGTIREFLAGTIFVEALRTRHRGVNAGTSLAKVLFIDHAEAGQSNMVRSEPAGFHHTGDE